MQFLRNYLTLLGEGESGRSITVNAFVFQISHIFLLQGDGDLKVVGLKIDRKIDYN